MGVVKPRVALALALYRHGIPARMAARMAQVKADVFVQDHIDGVDVRRASPDDVVVGGGVRKYWVAISGEIIIRSGSRAQLEERAEFIREKLLVASREKVRLCISCQRVKFLSHHNGHRMCPDCTDRGGPPDPFLSQSQLASMVAK